MKIGTIKYILYRQLRKRGRDKIEDGMQGKKHHMFKDEMEKHCDNLSNIIQKKCVGFRSQMLLDGKQSKQLNSSKGREKEGKIPNKIVYK